MTKQCEITNKRANNAYNISHSHVRTKKRQNVNLQYKKVWSITKQCWIKMRISTKALKTINRLGV
uniref:Large ribosomal subunit protein bL28c n=1 Tax=Rhodogorgon sp. TaxID=2485824 RepID=A0A3G3MI63_9FLOR|nr:ribosomal protein L28 [Rhodogorgon sp.]